MIAAPISSRSLVQRGLHAALRADRHEGRRLHHAVRRRQRSQPRGAVGAAQREAQTRGTRLIIGVTSLAKKLRVGVIYGGRSGEHEVSIASAASICENLDPARYETVPIHIAKDGRWSLPPSAPKALSAADVLQQGELRRRLQVVEPTTALAGSRDRRGVPDPPRPLRRGRHGAGPAGAGRRALRRRRRPGLGGGDGQGRDEVAVRRARPADRPPRHASTGTSGSATRARRLGAGRRAGLPALRQARQPRLERRHLEGASDRRRWRRAVELALEFDRKLVIEAGVAERPGDRVRGAGQRRPGGVAARRGHRHAPRRLLLLRRQVRGP